MFAGHIGVALVAARVEPRLNLGALAASSLLPDILLWLFILLGWESVVIPADFAQTHQPEFTFPYSHSLLATGLWSAMAGATALWRRPGDKYRSIRPALIVTAVVLSHWFLDVLVHRPELPLSAAGTAQAGLGLWNNMPVALIIEALLVAVGILVFFPGCGLSREKRLSLLALILLVLAFTVAGMTISPSPPSATMMAVSSLFTIAVVCWLMGRLAGNVQERQTTPA